VAADIADSGLQAGRIEIERLLDHVHEHRRSAGERDDLSSGDEGEGRHEHGIPRADASRHQRMQQRIGAACASEHVPGAAKIARALLKFGHL
jgi:hypothetical protein